MRQIRLELNVKLHDRFKRECKRQGIGEMFTEQKLFTYAIEQWLEQAKEEEDEL